MLILKCIFYVSAFVIACAIAFYAVLFILGCLDYLREKVSNYFTSSNSNTIKENSQDLIEDIKEENSINATDIKFNNDLNEFLEPASSVNFDIVDVKFLKTIFKDWDMLFISFNPTPHPPYTYDGYRVVHIKTIKDYTVQFFKVDKNFLN
jgi:hypothetical protein